MKNILQLFLFGFLLSFNIKHTPLSKYYIPNYNTHIYKTNPNPLPIGIGFGLYARGVGGGTRTRTVSHTPLKRTRLPVPPLRPFLVQVILYDYRSCLSRSTFTWLTTINIATLAYVSNPVFDLIRLSSRTSRRFPRGAVVRTGAFHLFFPLHIVPVSHGDNGAPSFISQISSAILKREYFTFIPLDVVIFKTNPVEPIQPIAKQLPGVNLTFRASNALKLPFYSLSFSISATFFISGRPRLP